MRVLRERPERSTHEAARQAHKLNVDRMTISRSVHADDLGVPAGEFSIGVPDLASKRGSLLLETVQRAARITAFKRCLGDVEDDRQIGLKALSRDAVEFAAEFLAEVSGMSLIGEGGQCVALTNDNPPGLKGRTDKFHRVLRSSRLVEQEFGEGVDLVLRVEHQRADRLGERGSAGLTRVDGLESVLGERLNEQSSLGGLAGFVGAFENDELSAAGLEARGTPSLTGIA